MSCYAAGAQPLGLKTRTVDAGFLSKAPATRVGRLENDPPQFGQRPPSFDSTQVVQNVHSKEQIQASFESGGRSVLQHSQPGRICSMSGSYREGRQLSRGITLEFSGRQKAQLFEGPLK